MTRREFLGMASVGVVAVAIVGSRALTSGSDEASGGTWRIQHTDAEWRAKLAPASYAILRKGKTEAPGSSPLVKEHRKGIFACAGCDQPLFASSAKYDSQTGWPSFWEALPEATKKKLDFKMASPRTEVLCSACGGHLGHVFDDGPKPTGLRYCMNGAALAFQPAKV